MRRILLCLAFAAPLVAGELPKRFTETVKDKKGGEHRFEMVLIPGGEFAMGSPTGEEGRRKDEGAQHKVVVRPFYMATTEVTFDLYDVFYDETHQPERDKLGVQPPLVEWQQAMEKLKGTDAIVGPSPPYSPIDNSWGREQRPVIMVSWYHAMIFCKWLSRKTGKTYRLPTEAEWEYAARAGKDAPFFFGEEADALEEYAWFEDNSDDKMTQEVAKKKPNPWGLYDMLGNVYEWCLDFYGEGTYDQRAKTNPWDGTKPLDKGKVHVARGGAWDSPAEELRTAARLFQTDDWLAGDPQEPKSRWYLPKIGIIGFRVVCETEPGNRWEAPAK